MSLIGKTIKHYTLVECIGTGGMGSVFLGQHREIGRKAAIKVMHPRFASVPEILQRFFNEARAANMVDHQNIVDIYDHGTDSEIGPYLIMEYLNGESLKKRFKRDGRMGPIEAATILRRVSTALHAAHRNGIIHRDVKPANIYLLPDADHPGEDRVKLLDFGVAKLLAESKEARIPTESGMLLGTPVYMAPEQCQGSSFADHRSDIYSLGVIAYEAVCGEPPFTGKNDGRVLAAHMKSRPTPPRSLNPYIPAAFEEVILRALEKKPADRYQTMEQFGRALRNTAEEPSGEVVSFTDHSGAVRTEVDAVVSLDPEPLDPELDVHPAMIPARTAVARPPSRSGEELPDFLAASSKAVGVLAPRVVPVVATTVDGAAGAPPVDTAISPSFGRLPSGLEVDVGTPMILLPEQVRKISTARAQRGKPARQSPGPPAERPSPGAKTTAAADPAIASLPRKPIDTASPINLQLAPGPADPVMRALSTSTDESSPSLALLRELATAVPPLPTPPEPPAVPADQDDRSDDRQDDPSEDRQDLQEAAETDEADVGELALSSDQEFASVTTDPGAAPVSAAAGEGASSTDEDGEESERALPSVMSEIPTIQEQETATLSLPPPRARSLISRLPMRVVAAGGAVLLGVVSLAIVLSQDLGEPAVAEEEVAAAPAPESPPEGSPGEELDSIEPLLAPESTADKAAKKPRPRVPRTPKVSAGTKVPRASAAGTPRDRASAEYSRGMRLLAARARGKGLAALRKAVKIDPSYPEPHKALGAAFVAEGNVAAMCKEFKKYIRLAPTAWDSGKIRSQMKKYAGTIPECRVK